MNIKDHYKKDNLEIDEPCNTCIAKYWSTYCNRCKNCIYYSIKMKCEIDFSTLVPVSGHVPID